MADEPRTDWSEVPEPESPLSAATATAAAAGPLDERPEILVGAAFVGGFVVARILKKVGE